MTGREIASLFNAKRVGKGRWVALCTAHPDRKPSLSITEGRKAVLLRCQSQQCAVRDICKGVGIEVKALWYQQSADPREIRKAEKDRANHERVRLKILDQVRERTAELERWGRVAAALYWHHLRKPHDKQIEAWYEEALDSCLGDPATWPTPAPYCPFPPQKLLHNIQAHHVTPPIARFLKLPKAV